MRVNLIGATVAGCLVATGAMAQTAGTDEDIAFAGEIWQEMMDTDMVGDGAILGLPYMGAPPHGAMLETFFMDAEVAGEEGLLVIKRNYGPMEVTADEVLADPSGHLEAVTIMFQRAEGYDSEHNDWFYAKYGPDGSLDTNPAGMALAGAVGRNMEAGCIACHVGAGGDDYLFTTDAYPPRAAE